MPCRHPYDFFLLGLTHYAWNFTGQQCCAIGGDVRACVFLCLCVWLHPYAAFCCVAVVNFTTSRHQLQNEANKVVIPLTPAGIGFDWLQKALASKDLCWTNIIFFQDSFQSHLFYLDPLIIGLIHLYIFFSLLIRFQGKRNTTVDFDGPFYTVLELSNHIWFWVFFFYFINLIFSWEM